jgi:two-component system CheB/CheR fusion protein
MSGNEGQVPPNREQAPASQDARHPEEQSAASASAHDNQSHQSAPSKDDHTGQSRRFLIVGVGASAGGLEALEEFFSSVPAGSGLAYVVIQHLAPQHASMLAQLLGRGTKMEVREVQDGAPAEADHVYVIAPGTVLGIAGGSFQVRTGDGDRHAPIDAFLSSLAKDQGENAVGIVLSGSGTDGTIGLRAIKAGGGLTLAQSPETAKHDSMPRSAIEARVVDQVLPPEAMPPKLLERARDVAEGRAGTAPSPAVPSPATPSPEAPSDEQLVACLDRVYEVLQHATGHDFSHYKRGTVLRRLRRRVLLHDVASANAYVEILSKQPQEPELLAKDLLIGVTQFFRDPEAFDYLALHVLPRILTVENAGQGVRIWVAACGSGEEAYSIGMLVRERLAGISPAPVVQIFATDIDGEAIAEARLGRYPAEIARHVSPERLARFFTRDGPFHQVAKDVREMCVFSEHSLIRDPPFLNIDLLSCRNVLIYLDADLQKKLVPVLHYALRRDGYLFLGSSEGLAGNTELFESVDKQFRVFRRVETMPRPLVSLPLTGRAVPPAPPRPPTRSSTAVPEGNQAVCSVFERIMLQEYGTPGAVVNARGDVLCVAGPTGRYLQPPTGILSTNLLDVAHTSLRIDLRTALHQATRSGRKVVRDDVAIELDGTPRRLRLTVQPLPGLKREGLFVVAMQEMAPRAVTGAEEMGAPSGVAAESESAIEQLESELRTARAELRGTIEELESANEELKSSNEELLSTNEEMQSSNEELQSSQEELKSVNEELSTVNAELSRKVDELERANSDLKNLFRSTEVATLFLDRELRITRASATAMALFKLIEADTGRLISDLAPRFVDLDIASDVGEVLRSLRPVEREVQTLDRQSWFLLRILPYRTVQDEIAGVVVTLTDITRIKKDEAELRRLATVVLDSNDAVTVLDLDGRVLAWNRGAERMYGYSAQEALGMNVTELVPERGRAQVQALLDVIARGEEVSSLEVKRRTKDGDALDVWLTITKLVDERGRPVAVATTERDITVRKRSEAAARAAAEQFRQAIEEAPIPVIMHAEDGEVLQISRSWTELTGYTREDMRSLDAWLNRAYGTGAEAVRDHVRALFRGDQREMGVEFPIRTRDGQTRNWSVSASSPGTLEDGRRFIIAMAVDMTERRRAEDELRQSETHFRALVTASSEVLYRMSPDWSEMRELYSRGFLANTEGPSRTWLQDYIPPEAQPQVAAAIKEAIWTRSVYQLEHRVLRADGTLGWTFSRAVPLMDAGGQVVEWFGVASDITERKQAEAALREAKERLEEADKRKDEFLAMLSHELRNPLAPIRNSLYILGRAAPGGEQAERAQAIINRQVEQMTRLIDDLLDVTRITRGKVHLQWERLDLDELVQRTVDDHRSVFAKSKVELEVSPAPAEVWVNGDRTRLAQVIGNLLQNAAKFTPPGGKTTVSVETDIEQRQAVVVVRDTGKGISPKLMPRLFEAFMQADTTLDRGRGGLGLGLTLVKGLVEMHGGSVRGESDGPGKGAAFTLRLPLDTSAAAAAPNRRHPRGDRAQRRVLVIEDNVDAAHSLREVLEVGNHVVEVAYSGPQGIEKARVFRPDIVICDIGLPEVDGYEVARGMRADPALSRVALVALTGYAQPEDVAKAREAGFDAHIAKPPSLDALEGVLEDVENGSRFRQ